MSHVIAELLTPGRNMISKKAKYALKALVYLAKEPEGQPALIADIAEQENIPKKFLDAILLEMRNEGILKSRKGKGGGYFLARPPEKIVLASVMRLIDGPLAPVLCVSKTAYRRCDDCDDENACRIRTLMRDVRDGILEVMENRTLADLVVKRARAPSAKAKRLKSSRRRAA